MFHGTYSPEDVTLLLQPIDDTSLLVTKEEKEALILNGDHYSSVVVRESLPTSMQMETYYKTLKEFGPKIATGVSSLAFAITHDASFGDEIVLISLVRAGTPMGVLLKRAIERESTRKVYHYGVSIIRDKGIDSVAMNYIMKKHRSSAEFYFVDGWTGKGTIFNSLKDSLTKADYWSDLNTIKTVVFNDPAKVAWISASQYDMLLPFAVLNSTIAGLISRTIYREDGFHGVYVFDDLEEADLTCSFIEHIDNLAKNSQTYSPPFKEAYGTEPNHVLDQLIKEHGKNRVKPSISECTRALLRRIPKEIIVSDLLDPDLDLIFALAIRECIPLTVNPDITPYKAIGILI